MGKRITSWLELLFTAIIMLWAPTAVRLLVGWVYLVLFGLMTLLLVISGVLFMEVENED